MANIERNVTAKDVDAYFKGAQRNAATGLVLLDKLIQRVASKDADWDGLSRFIVLSGATGDASKVKKIVRLAFGNSLTFAYSKTHATGGKITLGWKGNEGFTLGNGYGAVTDAIQAKVGWNDKAFLKSLDDKLAPKVQKKREVTDKASAAVEKHIADYLIARMAEGFNIGEILDRAQATLAAAKVAQEAVKAAKIEPAH
jgi:ribosomal protein L12E/L44/L45/RPP1/RPP2